jgi:FSR family fosmidomycin resistance protein-like MFS transporter
MVYLIAFSIPAAILLWRVAGPRQRERLEVAWTGAAAPAAAGGIPGPTGRDGSARLGGRAARILLLLIAFVVLRSWVSVGTASFIPLFFTGIRHLDPRYGGMLVSLFLGAGAVGSLLGGIAADRYGGRTLLIGSTSILPPLLLLITRTTGIVTMTAAAIAGMAAISTFSVVMVMAQDLMPKRIGMISGLIIGFAVGMGGIGVTLLGAIADRWGLQTAMDATALLPAAALTIALALPGGRSSRPMPRARGADPHVAGETWD